MSKSLRWIARDYAAPQWRFYLGGTFALVVTNIIVLEVPLLAKDIINAIAAQKDLDEFTIVALAIILLGFAQILIRTASRILIFWPGRALEADLKSDVFYNILISPVLRVLDFSVGELTSRLNNDVTQLRIFFAFGALQVLNVIFISLFTVSKMASIDPLLTVLSVSPMMLMLLLTKIVMPKLYKSMRENTEALGRLTGKVSEAFSQVHVIQMMNAIPTMESRFEPDNSKIFRSNISTIWLRTLTWPVMTVLIGLSQFATLAWGGSQVIAGLLTVGDIMAFNIYIGMLTFPFASLGIILNVYQRAKPASERLEEIKSIAPEGRELRAAHDQQHDTKPAQTAVQLLEVDNLGFSWQDGRVGVRDVSFTIASGERVGIYGKIGSGKSTLFNLLTKLYPIGSGDIKLEGKSLTAMTPREVRSRIGYALQTPLLLSESIKANLCLGCEDEPFSMVELQEAAQKADILSDIENMPEQWNTLIGERGIKLSGGQKQRLALARLLLRTYDLYILDDILSAVDHHTETRLIASLLATKSALLIASHRPSILRPCNKIIVLEQGKITAIGPYEQIKHLIEVTENTKPSGAHG